MATGPAQLFNRDDPVPMYHQIFVAIRDKILSGGYEADSVLPSEAELASHYGVSRITAKRALDEVAARGLVVRERGRGTRVLSRKTAPPLLASVEGLLENNLTMGLETSVHVLDFDYVPADEVVAEAIRVPRGTVVQYATRVRSMAETPFSFIRTWVPESVGRSFDRHDLANMPLLQLLERTGIEVTRATQTIGAEAATTDIAKALNVETGAALLRIERVVFGKGDRPVEYIRSLYCPSRYQYRMDLKRLVADGGNVWRSNE